MQTLPKDALYELLLQSDVSEILRLCQVDTRFATICKSEQLWESLFRRDFPNYPLRPTTTWKGLFKKEYVAQKTFRTQYPFWYQRHRDPQLTNLFGGGWYQALDKWHNAPAMYHYPQLELIYQLAYQLSPEFRFVHPSEKYIAFIPYIQNRIVTLWFPLSVTPDALGRFNIHLQGQEGITPYGTLRVSPGNETLPPGRLLRVSIRP